MSITSVFMGMLYGVLFFYKMFLVLQMNNVQFDMYVDKLNGNDNNGWYTLKELEYNTLKFQSNKMSGITYLLYDKEAYQTLKALDTLCRSIKEKPENVTPDQQRMWRLKYKEKHLGSYDLKAGESATVEIISLKYDKESTTQYALGRQLNNPNNIIEFITCDEEVGCIENVYVLRKVSDHFYSCIDTWNEPTK